MLYSRYKYIIIGAGSAGSQLLLSMLKDPFFEDDTFLIIDSSKKLTNDKTWCFWENSAGPYENLIFHKWDKGRFINKKSRKELKLQDYQYKMLRSIDFYQYCREVWDKDQRVTRIEAEVTNVDEGGLVQTSDGREWMGSHIFDSRIPSAFKDDTESVKILQHFKGWVIKTKDPVFDEGCFDMMDYRFNKENSTSFTYVLPFDNSSALIEFTLFDESLLNDAEYDEYLKKYIKNRWGDIDYEIRSEESGVIPMSDFSFEDYHTYDVTLIGTAGGWVKPSSGYSFKNSQKYIARIIQNIKLGYPYSDNVLSSRHRFYDRIFLDVLEKYNERGEKYFGRLYKKQPIKRLFRFLDEESSFGDELLIMSQFINIPFTKALLRVLFS